MAANASVMAKVLENSVIIIIIIINELSLF